MKKLIAITLPDFFPEEAERINSLICSGLERLHLRKPHADRESIKVLLDNIAPANYSRIVLHDHFDLAGEFSLGGIHLNQRNPNPLLSFKGTVSRSCHYISELKEHPDLDYLFLSPVFPSISKSGYGSGFPKEELMAAAKEGIINERIFALGGISAEMIPLLQEIPFGGVAVLGALWGTLPCLEANNHLMEMQNVLSHNS